MLTEIIGVPAVLEQLAEESSELTQAALKYARDIRGENKTHKDRTEIVKNFHEEICDIMICLDDLVGAGIVNMDEVELWSLYKTNRMKKRLQEDGYLPKEESADEVDSVDRQEKAED